MSIFIYLFIFSVFFLFLFLFFCFSFRFISFCFVFCFLFFIFCFFVFFICLFVCSFVFICLFVGCLFVCLFSLTRVLSQERKQLANFDIPLHKTRSDIKSILEMRSSLCVNKAFFNDTIIWVEINEIVQTRVKKCNVFHANDLFELQHWPILTALTYKNKTKTKTKNKKPTTKKKKKKKTVAFDSSSFPFYKWRL